MFEKSTDLLVIYQNINIFTPDTFIPPSFRKKICALHPTSFSNHPLVTTLSLFLKMSEVCNISNVGLNNKSANKTFLQNTPHILPSFQKTLRSPSQIFLETLTFHHIFSSLHSYTVDEVCNISNKNQPPSNLAKLQYLRYFISLIHIKEKWRSLSKMFFYHIFTIFNSE